MMNSRTNRLAGALLATTILWIALALSVAASFASSAVREYDSQITGLTSPQALSMAPGDQLLVSDVQLGNVYKYDAYPSQTKLKSFSGDVVWGGSQQVHSLALSAANDYLYVGTDEEQHTAPTVVLVGVQPRFGIFDNFGNVLLKTEPTPLQMWIATDNNPAHDAYGRIFRYMANYEFLGGTNLEMFDGYGNPVPFDASAPYISGNRITGTPAHTFEPEAAGYVEPMMPGMTIDADGNIWIVDEAKKQIDEFAPSGLFLQTITRASSGAPETTNTSPLGTKPYGGYPGLGGIAVDPTTGDIAVGDLAGGVVYEFSPQGKYIGTIDGSETPAGKFGHFCYVNAYEQEVCNSPIGGLAFNSEGYLYVADSVNHVVDIFKPRPPQPTIAYKPYDNATDESVVLHADIGLNGGGAVTDCKFVYGPTSSYGSSKDCEPAKTFGSDQEVSAALGGLSPETTYHYRVEVSNANATRLGPDQTFTPHKVHGLRADPATAITAAAATLNGSFVGNGAHTTYWFEYGRRTAYTAKVPLPAPPGADAGSPTGPGRTNVAIGIAGLAPATRYHYRIVADNGSVSDSEDQSFRTAPRLPQVETGEATNVHSEQVELHGDVNPGGADTSFSFEYGEKPCSANPCSGPPIDIHVGSNLGTHPAVRRITGLEAKTKYFYRIVATNAAGTVPGPDRTFTTQPFSSELKDPCGNALARQQTGAALVTDCRAYELVSSAHAGGYDVESTLVPGQKPFDGYPRADGRVLYGIHNGAIPGVAGNPTNKGVDPYVAIRGPEGWTTSYVGIPANNPNATSPFASTLLEADQGLDTFAFGGSDICSPCFADGTTGVPVHMPDGSLEQGMQGSIEPPTPATSDGLVAKSFSGDGSHFVFSSTSKFAAGGNDGTGDVSIYDRDLETGTTQVVSNDAGNPLTCPQGAGTCHAPGNRAGISELDISGDGSRIVVGQRISTDIRGNNYFHLYMHIGSSPNLVDLMPGASAGALFGGMTEDGSRVFFTTKDPLGGGDADTSADVYEAAVGGSGSFSLRLVSTEGGTASNDDSCNPPGFPTTWNSPSGAGKCNAVAFAGGAGLAVGSGTFYFVSPELLDSASQADGEADQPNLYVVQPDGDPEFVATIDTSVGKPAPPADYAPGTNKVLLSGLERAESIAVDQNSGDVYVAEAEIGSVSRWKPDGTADNFSALGTNRITGQTLGGNSEGQIAVDSSDSPFKGAVYVTTNAGAVNVFAEDGEQLGELNGFGEACGVAVDQSNGDVYVGSYYPAEVIRFRPSSATAPVTNSNYEVTGGMITPSYYPCNIDTSAEGHLYVWPYGGGTIEQFLGSSLKTAPFPAGSGKPIGPGLNAQTDPVHGDLFADEGGKITRYDPEGNKVEEFGSGALTFSHGIGINGSTGHVYATSEGSKVVDFQGVVTDEPIDHPGVVHALKQAGTHDYGDFQVSTSGDYATFATRMPLDESYENRGHSEVYRYDVADHQLNCVSCAQTNSLATGDANIASNGLSIADDGRVFFNAEDELALRDDNHRQDVYEWEEEGVGPDPGKCDASSPNQHLTGVCVSLISTGTSQFDSSLLSASADGVDVFFFTHDSLSRGDFNGPLTKIYDARSGGGIFAIPASAKCAASDECHGPGTEEAAPPQIATKAGSPGNHPLTKPCKKGFVRRGGKCVRVKKKHGKHKKHHHGRVR
jgi:sugar lactone lactonase YvrE